MNLTCRNISKSFGGVRALSEVSIEFPRQGIVAIIGPNGAGKTTLIDTLTGIVPQDDGSWHLDERDISRLPTEQIAEIGIVRSFQGIRLLPHQSVIDNITLAIPDGSSERLRSALFHFRASTRRREVIKAAEDFAELAGLNGRGNDPIGALSYGEQKLVSAVVAAATSARILLLDEPLAGVHGEGVSRICTFVRRLASMGRLVVFVEHDMSAVRELAETVVVMDQGKTVAIGPTDEILNRSDLLEAYFA